MAGNKKSIRKSAKTSSGKALIDHPLRTIDADKLLTLKIYPWTRLEEFRTEHATTMAWYDLRFRLQIGIELARDHFSNSVISEMKDALTIMQAIFDRYKDNGATTWRVTPLEFDILRDALLATDFMEEMVHVKDRNGLYRHVSQELKQIAIDNQRIVDAALEKLQLGTTVSSSQPVFLQRA